MGDESNGANTKSEVGIAPTTELATKQNRKGYMSQYYADNKEEIAARRKATRMARREEINAADRETYSNDPAARERRLETNARGRKTYRERLAADPEAKKQHEKRIAKRRQRHRERLATDPKYRRQREIFAETLREKRKKKDKEGNGLQ